MYEISKKYKHFPCNRFGNKYPDLKDILPHLPQTEIKTVVEAYGGTFAIIRGVFNDYKKYNLIVYENDEEFLDILKLIMDDLPFFYKYREEVNSKWTNNIKLNRNLDYLNYKNKKEYPLKKFTNLNYDNFKEFYNNINIINCNCENELHKYYDDEQAFIIIDPPLFRKFQ